VIENDTQALDSFRRQAKFYLKFAVGTRKNPVRLKFGIQLQIQQNGTQSQTVTVESNSSRSFIVITNECQWEEAEGILLKKDAFGEQVSVVCCVVCCVVVVLRGCCSHVYIFRWM